MFQLLLYQQKTMQNYQELLSEGFTKPVYWNKNKVIPNKIYNADDYIRQLFDSSCQGVKRLFVLAYRDGGGANIVTADSHRRYFLPRVKMENYNVEIYRRNFHDQPINNVIKQYDKVRKVSTGQGSDYVADCFLDFAYFLKKLQINCR